jgi:hypothetical protein
LPRPIGSPAARVGEARADVERRFMEELSRVV